MLGRPRATAEADLVGRDGYPRDCEKKPIVKDAAANQPTFAGHVSPSWADPVRDAVYAVGEEREPE